MIGSDEGIELVSIGGKVLGTIFVNVDIIKWYLLLIIPCHYTWKCICSQTLALMSEQRLGL